MKVKILKEFRDKYNFSKLYKVGDEVDGFDEARISDLKKRGLVEVVGGASVATGLDVSKAAKEVIEAVQTYSDLNVLREALELENSKESPRKTVVSAIEARIADLNPEE